MKILYISGGRAPDYLCDMLFHGLRKIFGFDVIDVSELWFMYRESFESGEKRKQDLYGKGFSVYGLLNATDQVDREDVPNKILCGYYDLIIYGSVQRCLSMIDEVLQAYPPGRILFIDGEDSTDIVRILLGKGLYFKRELLAWKKYVLPIHFAIPKENIYLEIPAKNKTVAYIDPSDRTTYVYETQSAYYQDYQESLFGITSKKSGWDCLRHYEIMANGCVPLFRGLEECPISTMTRLPKYQMWKAYKSFQANGGDFFLYTLQGRSEWQRLHNEINSVFMVNCTTESLASYVIDEVKRCSFF